MKHMCLRIANTFHHKFFTYSNIEGSKPYVFETIHKKALIYKEKQQYSTSRTFYFPGHWNKQ